MAARSDACCPRSAAPAPGVGETRLIALTAAQVMPSRPRTRSPNDRPRCRGSGTCRRVRRGAYRVDGARMTCWGYTLWCEGNDPRALVEQAVAAEAAGFEFLVISDHFHPWLPEQRHSGFAWSILGAVAQATSEIELATMVTCPIIRYHPAIIAQAAATIGVLSEGRFTLGLGAGERLNEHIVGAGFPAADIRQEMLAEAIEIFRLLWSGGYQS